MAKPDNPLARAMTQSFVLVSLSTFKNNNNLIKLVSGKALKIRKCIIDTIEKYSRKKDQGGMRIIHLDEMNKALSAK